MKNDGALGGWGSAQWKAKGRELSGPQFLAFREGRGRAGEGERGEVVGSGGGFRPDCWPNPRKALGRTLEGPVVRGPFEFSGFASSVHDPYPESEREPLGEHLWTWDEPVRVHMRRC